MGGDLTRQCLAARLLDVRLELLDSRTFDSGVTLLRYEPETTR
jgi:hypothetical protein